LNLRRSISITQNSYIVCMTSRKLTSAFNFYMPRFPNITKFYLFKLHLSTNNINDCMMTLNLQSSFFTVLVSCGNFIRDISCPSLLFSFVKTVNLYYNYIYAYLSISLFFYLSIYLSIFVYRHFTSR